MKRSFPYNYIAIEGNIGAGKTTLCKMLEQEYGCKLILEGFEDNPFLPKFYDNKERYAFPVELFFMTERHKQLQTNLKQQELFSSGIVSDYFFLKTLLFAKNNLNDEEYRLFQRLFTVLNSTFPTPELIVYLHRPVESLLANIKKRGRDFETEITGPYLESIQKAYFDYFDTQSDIPSVIIDIDKLDFENNKADYQFLMDQIDRAYQNRENNTGTTA